jgi:hypothetical protein
MCLFFKSIDVDFRKFIDGSWTEIPSPFLVKSKVSSTIQIKT